MQSKTSSCERSESVRCPHCCGTLLRKDLTRFWPLWAVYAAVWLVLLPLMQFVSLFGSSAAHQAPAQRAAGAAQNILSVGVTGGLILGVGFGCLFAMALFSYLCSPRAVGMFHSFPIRREGLFLTHYLTGAAVFLCSQALALLLTAAVQGAAGVLDWSVLGLCFLCAAGQMLFFYSFSVFCAMFTGQILAIPAFYAVGNVLVAGVTLMVESLAGIFVYGYSSGGMPAWTKWMTPAWQLGSRLQVQSDWNSVSSCIESTHLTGLGTVGIYALAGLVLTAAALAIYRRRRSETAGDTVTIRRVKPVFCFGVAACFALSLGQGLYYLLWTQFNSSGTTSLPVMLVCLALLGLVGYYAARMLVCKSFRVFRRYWKGAAAVTAAVILLGVCVSLDLTGAERRVPDADRVASLDFTLSASAYCSGTTEDPALIARFADLHRLLISDRDTARARNTEQQAYYGSSGKDSAPYGSGWISLHYTLKSGAVLSRSYNLLYTDGELSDSGSAAYASAALLADPQVQWLSLLRGQDPDEVAAALTTGSMDYFTSGGYTDSRSFDADTAQTLYAALRRDVEAGHLGAAALMTGQEWSRQVYINSLTFYYTASGVPGGQDQKMDSFSIQFSSACTELIAALRATGVADAGHPLLTVAESEAANAVPATAAAGA